MQREADFCEIANFLQLIGRKKKRLGVMQLFRQRGVIADTVCLWVLLLWARSAMKTAQQPCFLRTAIPWESAWSQEVVGPEEMLAGKVQKVCGVISIWFWFYFFYGFLSSHSLRDLHMLTVLHPELSCPATDGILLKATFIARLSWKKQTGHGEPHWSHLSLLWCRGPPAAEGGIDNWRS